ncbi:spaetzle domain-containing protein 6 [Tachypleus tridentatus]|uniref:spaetzle domain-containing protein 6 n=1 Tax=Tachypleus tridentatus TaxID=6853 RepID=UPI003FD1CEC1
MAKHITLIFCFLWTEHTLISYVTTEKEVFPKGFFPFEEASTRYQTPPKVRKPPYLIGDGPCPGVNFEGRFPPKYSLCGDLSRGFIPQNPMNQFSADDPYPFDLIKAKTLKFLSTALPFLKEDPKIPKVARFVGAPVSYREPGGFDLHQTTLFHRKKRFSDHGAKPRKATIQAKNDVTSTENYNQTETTVDLLRKKENLTEYLRNSSVTSRELCPQGSGLLCSLVSTMTSLYFQSQASNSDVQNYVNDPSQSSSIGLLSLLGTIINALQEESSSSSKPQKPSDEGNSSKYRSPLYQLLSILTGASSQSSSNNADTNTGVIGVANHAPTALSLILDLIRSGNSPLNYLSNILTNRRGTLSTNSGLSQYESQPPLNDLSEELPPTPCPSIEEYITPTFARNYKGVWKYVVQIPQEGYFTQTVQQTKCVRSHCDFTDGVCHESPRWVSLLVAEIFYPNIYFPTSTPTTPLSSSTYKDGVPPVEDFTNFQQYLRRRVGEPEAPSNDYPNYYQSNPKSSTFINGVPETENCDSYDEIGCYVVRMYYDWFLVNGSCKCWKPKDKTLFTRT